MAPARKHSIPIEAGFLSSLLHGLEKLFDLVLLLESIPSDEGLPHDFAIREASASAAELLGVAFGAIRGCRLSQALSTGRFPLPLAICRWVATSGEAHVFEDELRGDEGKSRRFLVRVTPVHCGLLVAATEVTAEHRHRAELERFAAVVDHGRSLVGFITPDLDRLYVNPAGRRLTGNEESAPLLFLERFPERFVRQFREQIAPAVASRGSWSGEARVRHLRTGLPLVLDLSCFAVHDRTSGRLLCYAAIARDVSVERRAGEELLRSTRELEAARHRIAQQAEELLRAKEAAEAATRAKSEFLANMSHEIRTPLTAVLGFADELLQGDSLDARAGEELAIIRRNAEHLVRIINDVLDLSRVEAGRLEIEPTEFSPSALVEEVMGLFWPLARQKGIVLAAERADDLPVAVRSDPARIRQVLLNLVGNAVKFTERGSIRLSAAVEPGEPAILRCDVTDTGIGMTPDQAGRLFEPFQQADASSTRRLGGSGLGLALSRKLARLLGGDVEIVSSSVQSGTGMRFTCRVQVATPATEASLPSPTEACESVRDLDRPACADITGLRVLLVDDGRDNRLLVRRILGKGGADVVTRADGAEGVEETLSAARGGNPYDVVLMDIQMPVMDGYAATALLRSSGYRGRIIALTANAMAGERERCLTAGFDDYLTKPIERAKLFRAVAVPPGSRRRMRGPARSY